jgi:tRNA threonylcarbamoyladenosine biosynthesis protein TsaB
MNLLALDTSSDACSVALQVGKTIVERHVVRPKGHTQLLVPMIEEALDEAGATFSDLDAIVPGVGPGSFIGVRIAASVAQGIAFASKLKLVPVSSLAAVAAECFETAGPGRIAVAQDAHMNEVYLALFTRGDAGLPVQSGAALLAGIAPIAALAEGGASGWQAAGAGWQRYPELLARNAVSLAGVIEVLYPRARFLLDLARKDWAAGLAIEPDELLPDYLREQVATAAPLSAC